MTERESKQRPVEVQKVNSTEASNKWIDQTKGASEFAWAGGSAMITGTMLLGALGRENYGEALALAIPTAYTAWKAGWAALRLRPSFRSAINK